jgi:hypothetical protein
LFLEALLKFSHRAYKKESKKTLSWQKHYLKKPTKSRGIPQSEMDVEKSKTSGATNCEQTQNKLNLNANIRLTTKRAITCVGRLVGVRV